MVSFDYESVVITLKLPRVGTPPFTHLEVQFSRPEIYVQNITGIGLNVGNVVIIKLSDLQEGTVYLISVSVYNFGGKGMSSQQIQVTTSKLYLRALNKCIAWIFVSKIFAYL